MLSVNSVRLTWKESSDNVRIAGYVIYRNDATIVKTDQTFYVDTGLTFSTVYRYAVAAFDSTGNTSARSPVVQLILPEPVDTLPPSSPHDLAAAIVAGTQIRLTWVAATDNDGVASYVVVRNNDSIATTVQCTFADMTLIPSTEYVYTVIAVDSAGNRSAVSERVTARLPLILF